MAFAGVGDEYRQGLGGVIGGLLPRPIGIVGNGQKRRLKVEKLKGWVSQRKA